VEIRLNISSLLQALKVDMVPFLVQLLDRGLEGQDSPAAIKAQIVKTIKAMQTSFKYGDEVRKICAPECT
jgi:DnaJ family protein C protein 13